MSEVPQWEQTVQKTVVKLRDVLGRLHKIWEEIGYTHETRAFYCTQAYNHIQDLLNDMVLETQQAKVELLENVKKLMQQVVAVCEELGTEPQITGYEYYPLKELEEILQGDLQKWQLVKEQRLTRFQELLDKEKEICRLLGTLPIGMETHLPSEEELNSFKLYLEKQENEKNRLEALFKDIRRSIIRMMDELGITPSLNFEHIIYNEPQNFVFSNTNMGKLREFRDQLKTQVDEAKQNVEQMRQELVVLWKYLEEPEHILASLLNDYVGINSTTRSALSAELKRCKEKKRQNIAKCVDQVRDTLVKLWDLCKYGEEQRKEFSVFYSQTYTEDLLTLHELEVERLKKFYECNQPLFELLEEREKLWSKMKELLKRANNPDRFYNRGGQLLMEEKERKTIQKKLPKIEEELRTLIAEYENVHGETFTINGVSINELLKESWENFNEEKQIIKKARKEAKDKSVKKVTPNASKKTPSVLSTRRPTPLSTSKRKLLFSPSPNNSAKRRNLTIMTNGSKLRKSGRVSKKILPSPAKSLKKPGAKENSQSSVVTDTTYSQFKEHLEDRKELRSSLLPEQVLMNANKSRMRTPVKTPVKPLRKNLTATTTMGTPKLSQSRSGQKMPCSPRLLEVPKLVPASTPLPIIF